jgi:anthranilate synthase component 2
MILLIDNYDSFTWNIVQYLQEIGQHVEVVRNDARTIDELMAMASDAIVLSPGPKTPDEAGVCLDLVPACASAGKPLLGICLGHQAIGQHFGGEVRRGGLMHGKVSQISHDGIGIFKGLPSPFPAVRYHSLVVEDVPASLMVTAMSDDGHVMGLQHREFPIFGVQFHPESIGTDYGKEILANFCEIM